MAKAKKRIAVFFGGRSPEHDVSVVTALQVLSAVDSTLYDAFPVYISTDGAMFTGEALRERSNFLPDKILSKKLNSVTLDVNVANGTSRKGRLISKRSSLFGKPTVEEFDVAIPAFHGLYGEDGAMQGLFEVAGVPYTGMRLMATSLLMDKGATKRVLEISGIPVLPYTILKRPDEGYLIPKDKMEAQLKAAGLDFPCIIKPCHLGSSIGVARVENLDELSFCLPGVFEYDDAAIIEPFVENMVEYNVSVSKAFGGEIRISALERPKTTEELLDFKQKYLSGSDDKSGNKAGTKNPGQISEGMLSLTRELNPDLPPEMEANIQAWATEMFEVLDGSGAPRIDFISNAKTNEIWLNEVNPIPGSFGYFLWEACEDHPVLFSEFLSALIEEAVQMRKKRILPKDPVPIDARLLKRPL